MRVRAGTTPPGSLRAALPVHPDFDKCRACGAEAQQYVYWNPTGGWSCLACGGSDYEEAAE